jgi:hypothetical protein
MWATLSLSAFGAPSSFRAADATAREWAVFNKEIGNDVELITDPNYFIAFCL